MTTLLLAITLITAPIDGNATEAPRKFFDISQDVRDVIRVEARAETNEEKAAAIQQMTDLYLEIKRDPRLQTSNTLKSYKAKLWSRLTRIKKELEREFGIPHRAPLRGRVANATSKPQRSDVDELADEISDSIADQLGVVGGSLGGPAQVYSPGEGARGGAAKFDYGPALVELIERVIQPEFWDTNGGPGSIFYYKPLHALVITATSEIHHQVGGALDGLRRAGM